MKEGRNGREEEGKGKTDAYLPHYCLAHLSLCSPFLLLPLCIHPILQARWLAATTTPVSWSGSIWPAWDSRKRPRGIGTAHSAGKTCGLEASRRRRSEGCLDASFYVLPAMPAMPAMPAHLRCLTAPKLPSFPLAVEVLRLATGRSNYLCSCLVPWGSQCLSCGATVATEF